MLWSATTKKLLASNGFGDDVALADSKFDADELLALRNRVRNFRGEILHLSDKSQEGRAVHVSWTAETPHFAIKSSIGQRGKLDWDTITRAEVEGLLSDLDPWLQRHWERLVYEDDDEVSSAALGAKIDATMRALGGAETEHETRPDA